jgi:hypothetical protein
MYIKQSWKLNVDEMLKQFKEEVKWFHKTMPMANGSCKMAFQMYLDEVLQSNSVKLLWASTHA